MQSELARTLETPIGRLLLRCNAGGICALEAQRGEVRRDGGALLLQAERELAEYFAGRRRAFSVPLCLDAAGSEFQRAVWREIQRIPYGETASYRALARSIGRPTAARAAGMACRKNPLLIFIPCHRVIGADGSLTGYAGGLETKKFLLELEGKHV